MIDLTNKQREVLAFIVEFKRENEYPPSRQEIARKFGWASGNAVETHLLALASKGAIRLVPKTARGIIVKEMT